MCFPTGELNVDAGREEAEGFQPGRSEADRQESVHRLLERLIGRAVRVDSHPARGLEHLLELPLHPDEVRLVLEGVALPSGLDPLHGDLHRRVQVQNEVRVNRDLAFDTVYLAPRFRA